MTDPIAEAYSRQNFVYFDIETIPCQDPAYLDHLRDNITAPARYKKPESIAEWLAENRDTAAQDELDKTSFDGGYGHICTIAWAVNDGDIQSTDVTTVQYPVDEALSLTLFFDAIDGYQSNTLVGHYITGFDLPFLRKRAIVLGVTMPRASVFPRDPKAWDKSVLDTMTAWAGGRDSISQDNLCRILGIKGKGDFDGSMVAKAWADGEHDKIAEYCRDDVRQVREIHQKMIKAGF